MRAFRIVRLGILTYSVVVRSKNHRKISRPQVLRSFDRADFCPGEKKDAGNTPVFPSLLTMHGRKDAGQNLVCSHRLWYSIWYTKHIPKRYIAVGDADTGRFLMFCLRCSRKISMQKGSAAALPFCISDAAPFTECPKCDIILYSVKINFFLWNFCDNFWTGRIK